ncbi:phosphate acetyltransferase [Candidatus Dependentiae bacterium]|nr:phosphate acetyltransferase [Candidatus Dependentiae bacterium]
MDYLEQFKETAKRLKKTIVLPESLDERVLQAAAIITKTGLAKVILLGEPERIKLLARNILVDISGIEIIDYLITSEFDKYADQYFKLRKHKGVSTEESKIALRNPLYYAPFMLKDGLADAVVAGAAHTTSDVLRGAIRVLGTAEGIKTVSSFFIMVLENKDFGENGVLVFADCAILPEPDENQLADIAIMTADNTKKLLDFEPRVALLSFSTKGSADHGSVDTIKKALEIVDHKRPDIIIDGEFQADAAIVHNVAKRKAPGSKIKGNANVLIFPNLSSGNISYKLVQRLAGAKAIGPIIQGLAKPVNDLSRGCSYNDIVNVAAITAIMS